MPTEQEKTLNDILETVVFIKDHAASKQDLSTVKHDLEQRMATKTDLERFATKGDLGVMRDHLTEQMTTKEDLTAAKTEIMSTSTTSSLYIESLKRNLFLFNQSTTASKNTCSSSPNT